MDFYLFVLILTFLILIFFYILSHIIETSHYKYIKSREAYYKDRIVVTNLKNIPSNLKIKKCFFCSASIVISANYYKRFVASIKQIIGGHLKTLETVLDRGYREALLRLKEKAYRQGDNMIFNFRMETATVGRTGRRGENSSSIVEILVYGTAVETE